VSPGARIFSPRAVGGLMALVLMGGLALGAGGLARVFTMQREIETLERDLAALRVETRRLAETIERLRHDPAYVEKLAREELGWVRKGETVLKFTQQPR
jgi:cell division protein FtsB